MLPGIYRYVNGNFEPFDSITCHKILKAAANGEKTVVLSKSTIVLRAMEEVTQDGRRIHIQMVPQFGIENMKQLTTSVGVFIWMKVLADLSDAYIKAAIENTVKRTHSLESIKTRHSFTKDTSLVNKFAKTLAELSLRDARHVLGKIFQLFRPGTLGKVELVFHGTPSRNIKSIMTNGMDPSCRKSSPLGDWFSKSLTMPLQMSDAIGNTHILIVFLVLATEDVVVPHQRNSSSFIVINSSKHEIPLATITLASV